MIGYEHHFILSFVKAFTDWKLIIFLLNFQELVLLLKFSK